VSTIYGKSAVAICRDRRYHQKDRWVIVGIMVNTFVSGGVATALTSYNLGPPELLGMLWDVPVVAAHVTGRQGYRFSKPLDPLSGNQIFSASSSDMFGKIQTTSKNKLLFIGSVLSPRRSSSRNWLAR
jgi:hypothetical protein